MRVIPGNSIGNFDIFDSRESLLKKIDSHNVLISTNRAYTTYKTSDFEFVYHLNVLEQITFFGKDECELFNINISINDRIEKIKSLTEPFFSEEEEIVYLKGIDGICFSVEENNSNHKDINEWNIYNLIITHISIFKLN